MSHYYYEQSSYVSILLQNKNRGIKPLDVKSIEQINKSIFLCLMYLRPVIPTTQSSYVRYSYKTKQEVEVSQQWSFGCGNNGKSL
jgi:hypothetical protein